MHSKFMNETMYFNSKGFQGFILRTFRCTYGKLRENDRTDSPSIIKHSQNDFLFVQDFSLFVRAKLCT